MFYEIAFLVAIACLALVPALVAVICIAMPLRHLARRREAHRIYAPVVARLREAGYSGAETRLLLTNLLAANGLGRLDALRAARSLAK